jgi:hypothetical protein
MRAKRGRARLVVLIVGCLLRRLARRSRRLVASTSSSVPAKVLRELGAAPVQEIEEQLFVSAEL